MLDLRPSFSQAPIVAATDRFATSAFAQSKAEPIALRRPMTNPQQL
jgi:hypothetical protein